VADIVAKGGDGPAWAQSRVCVVDYTGVWWGLRSAHDGHGAGFPALIFGGEHADVPINDSASTVIGKLVAERDVATIIDRDGLTVGAQQRFMTAFCEEVYRCNTRLLHLVIEEADDFAPMTGARRRALRHFLDEARARGSDFRLTVMDFLLALNNRKYPESWFGLAPWPDYPLCAQDR
jgi:hypothetical protein